MDLLELFCQGCSTRLFNMSSDSDGLFDACFNSIIFRRFSIENLIKKTKASTMDEEHDEA